MGGLSQVPSLSASFVPCVRSQVQGGVQEQGGRHWVGGGCVEVQGEVQQGGRDWVGGVQVELLWGEEGIRMPWLSAAGYA